MGRGIGIRPSGSKSDDLFLTYEFDLFAQNDAGKLRTADGNGTFVDAAEDFDLEIVGSRFDLQNNIDPVDNEENPAQLAGELDTGSGDRFKVPTIKSLDFTAKEEIIEGTDYITYALSDSKLEEFGINRFIFALNIEDGETLPNGETLDLSLATTDIEYIIENELLNLDSDSGDDGIFVDAVLEDGSTEIIPSNNFDISLADISTEVEDTPEQTPGNEPTEFTDTILIEAEDLNLDTYLVESSGRFNFGLQGSWISLKNASANTGTASLQASDFGLSGKYDLEVDYFDEANGEAQIEILQNDNVLQSITLNENTFLNLPSELNRRTLTIEDIDIAATDSITIRGTADSGEWARVDNLSFIADSQSDAIVAFEQ